MGSRMGTITPTPPGVFLRAASKGLAGYGTWKSVGKMGGRARRNRLFLLQGIILCCMRAADGQRKRPEPEQPLEINRFIRCETRSQIKTATAAARRAFA